MKSFIFFLSVLLLLSCVQMPEVRLMTIIEQKTADQVIALLVSEYGESQRNRIEQGVDQVALLWKSRDGSAEVFSEFCRKNFVADSALLEETLKRFDTNLESLYGHLNEIERDFSAPMQLDSGPMLPVDYLFPEYAVFAHTNEDLFKTKIAFSALLNFPLVTLEERLKSGSSWSRQEWAAVRLTGQFDERIPAEVKQKLTESYVRADDYIGNYNICMHHLLDEKGNRLFPPGLKLISHWGLRDELKAQYAEPDGAVKQEMILSVMESIIRQDIPAAVIDNPEADWRLSDGSVSPSSVHDFPVIEPVKTLSKTREPDIRYEHLLGIFRAEKSVDPYTPMLPTKMDRRFRKDREISEERVEALFASLLTSDEVRKTAELIRKRLGRNLRPYDIWYNGFEARGAISETRLNEYVARKYPDIRSFQKDLPVILEKLGFDKSTAAYLGTKITVDPARGSGHAMGAMRRADNAHLRTRFAPGQPMAYKGYNIAIHELGHNVEQVFSLNRMDWTLLQGVPNTAFTEAFAFIFQEKDLKLLGLREKGPLDDSMRTLDMLWSAYEISAVSLVDMRVWHWMYVHPDASPSELREAVIRISMEVWNKYMAPVFDINDQIILGVYSHMIDAGLYLPDYSLGYIIAFQIENYLKGKKLGPEMERMCRLGDITPDAWMQTAVGAPISAEPMLMAAGQALEMLEK
jgi:hypothetical protein